MLADLVPLYEKIKNGNYQLLLLIAMINATYTGVEQNSIDALQESLTPLSFAQCALIKAIDFSVDL